tara:strand:+ start:408 stop:908 length:501 start_codon:yes stop_codon:yes gene_type:complete
MSGIINSVGSRSGIVGLDVYPAGHVIQQVHAMQGGTITVTNTSAYTDIISKAITPKFSDSHIHIACKATIRIPTMGGTNWIVFGVEKRTSGEAYNEGDNIQSDMYAGGGGGAIGADMFVGYSHTLSDTDHSASGTDEITYAYQLLPNYTGSWNAQYCNIVLSEIAV